MIWRQGVNGKSLSENSDDSGKVGVVGAQDDRVIGLDEVAKVTINVGGLVDVFRNREP